MDSFPYIPLQTPNSIRILRFQRDKSGDVTCRLQPFSLSDPACPDFTTLSYVWGKKKYSNSIKVNGHTFPILKALYPILEVICSDEGLNKYWWWIDSICIDQKTGGAAEVERNAQVRMMREIYERSAWTMGWLGRGKKDGEDGIGFLRVLLKNRERLEKQKEKEVKILGKELSDRKKWAAVERLLLRPWWTRVWTLQEYIVAKKFVFYCGKENISRHDLHMAANAIHLCTRIDDSLISGRAFERAWIRRRILKWKHEPEIVSLVGLLAYVGDYKATDPRDRIYSLLGLAWDGELTEPRYQDDVAMVYSMLVKEFVEYHHSLDIICLADRFNKDAINLATYSPLPSWVPDWRATVVPWVIPAMACQSSKNHIGNFRPLSERSQNYKEYMADPLLEGVGRTMQLSSDLRTLHCRGILLNYVDGIGGLKVSHRVEHANATWDSIHPTIPSTSPANTNVPPEGIPNPATKFLEQLLRCLLLNRKDRYLNYELSPGYFYKVFKTLLIAAKERPQDIDPQFLSWFQLNSSLLIRGQSLSSTFSPIAALPLKSRKLVEKLPDFTVFLKRFKDTTHWMTRRLISTAGGDMGMAPTRVRKDDQVWVLLGCSIPLILRRCDGDVLGRYEVVGECYLDGYMDGDIVRRELGKDNMKVENIEIR